tara:strand:+ start:762 stop:971 length:210 start_codon:yes stop_codon:yes gene_type:complete
MVEVYCKQREIKVIVESKRINFLDHIEIIIRWGPDQSGIVVGPAQEIRQGQDQDQYDHQINLLVLDQVF